MNLKLRKFNPKEMLETRICLIIGKRGSGKSEIAKNLLFHKRHIPLGIVCSATEEANRFFGHFVPDSFIYNEFDKGAVERLVDRQRKLKKMNVTSPAFCVLDDCMYSKAIIREKVMRLIFYNGRHLGLFTIMTSQYSLDLPPDFRSNVDYVFICRENIRANRERLWKAFAGIVPTFDQFNAIMDVVTQDYGCLVIDNTSKSNDISDCVFWYRAKPKVTFKMGSPAFWNYHRIRYDPNHDERSETSFTSSGGKVIYLTKK